MVDITQLLDEADSLRNKQGNLSGALEKINQVLEFDSTNTEVLVHKSSLLRDLGNLDESEGVLQLALEQIVEDNYLLQANIWRLLGFISLLRGNTDNALERAENAQVMAEKSDSDEMLANTQSLLGNIYQAKGEVNEALEYYNQALANALESRFVEREITLTINIASIKYQQGEKSEALEMLDGVIERASGRWYKALFNALFEKGKILLADKKLDDKYIADMQSAYKIAAANGWNDEQGNLSLQLGRVFYNLKEVDIAREYLQTAKMLFEKSGMKTKQALVAEELKKI